MFELIIIYKYLILLPLAIMEGPFISLISGYLSRLGYLNLFFVILVLVLADILSDLLYYSIGFFSKKNNYIKNIFYKKNSGNKITFFEKLWENHFFLIMFFGKISYGISVPIIMSAGFLDVKLKKFLLFSIPVSIFQTSCLVLIGYLLGEAYYSAINYVKYPSIFIGFLFTSVILLLYYLKLKSKNIIIKTK